MNATQFHIEDRDAKMDRFMYYHGVRHPFRGNQMAFALVDAAVNHFNCLKHGDKVSPVYEAIVSYARGMQ